MFGTKKEKYAYVQGLRAGSRGKKPYPLKNRKQAERRTEKKSYGSHAKRYDDFERTSTGRIKGSYTADGFFEPD